VLDLLLGAESELLVVVLLADLDQLLDVAGPGVLVGGRG
jgi:hypothetical protein